MTRLALLLVLGLAAGPAGLAQSEEDVLRATERAWLDAYDHNDAEAMDRILADDFTIVYQNGHVVDKAQTLAGLNPGEPDDPATRQYTEGTVVRRYGDTAVLSGVYVWEGPGIVRRSRYTDTWVFDGERWRVVASHLTRIQEPPDGE